MPDITRQNVQEYVNLWVRRGTYTEEQGNIIVAAVFAGFSLYAGNEVVPESRGQKIRMRVTLKLEIE